MTTDAEALDMQDAPRDVPLGQLVSSLSTLVGDIPPHLVPTSCKSGLLNNAPTWERLAASTIADVLLWPGVGPGRAEQVLRFAARSNEFQPRTIPTRVRAERVRSDADAALQLVAAWAVHHGSTTGLEHAMHVARRPGTPPSVVAAADFLETIDLTTIALSPEERSFDHSRVAHDLLASFEGRELAILERVLAAGLRPVPTLEEIGKRFEITRERVRQLGNELEEKLVQRLRSAEYDVLVGHAEVLSAQVGVACPVAYLPAELQPGSSLTDELFAYLAGPYRLSDGWLLRRDLGTSPGKFARSIFDAIADDGVAAADALFDALSSAGVSPRWHLALLQEADRITLLDGHYARWGTHVERLTSMLALAGRPMTGDELGAKAQSIDPDIPVRSLLNRLADDDFRRVGRGRYALAAWDGEDYRGIVPEMEAVLASGQQLIADLSAGLVDRFGVSPVSVAMYATMHPRFVAADGVVRLRRDDEPYEITETLEGSDRCYQIDGAWSWRVPVDHDLLRGSGRAIPEAFAAHLGATPTHSVALAASGHQIQIGWGMTALVGSLRRRAEELELVEGDWLFMRHSSSSGVSFLPLPDWKLQAATPDERVRLLVGASEGDERALATCLADALGMAATQAELSDCVRVLQARGETEVLAALADRGRSAGDRGATQPATSLAAYREGLERFVKAQNDGQSGATFEDALAELRTGEEFFPPVEPVPGDSVEPAVGDPASAPEPAAAPSRPPTPLAPSSPMDLSLQDDMPEEADHPPPGAKPAPPVAEPALVAELSRPILWDGTSLSVGDWVHARRGGAGDGYVVAWPDQIDYPNWVRIQLTAGDQKVVHTRGLNHDSGLVRTTRPEGLADISAIDQPTSYAAMRLADGDPARPGQIVRHRFSGATGLLVGLIPNSGGSRVTLPGSNAGEWKLFAVGTLHLVEDVAQEAHPAHDRPGASPT